LKKKTAVIATAIIVLVIAAAAYWFRPKPLQVAVVAAARGDVTSTVANTRAGTVDACRRAGLSPAMGGQMARLPVQKGERVVAEQVLLELWNADLRAELLLARRDAQAARGKADEACVRATVAEREAKRLTNLRERGLVSEEAADLASGDAQALAAACGAAKDLVRVSDAKVDVASARLERTLLRAPFDGVIAEINGELGEYVTPSPVGIPTPPTVDLIDASCLYISAPIDEVDAPAVRAGQRANITMDAFPDRIFSGVVRRVAPYVLDVEKQARTVEIEAEISDSEGSNLLPGYSADVEVILDVRADVLRVPTQVVIDGQRVFVLANGTLEERAVSRGIANWEFTEIVDGLAEGELVVLSVDREGVADGVAAVRE
jgi:HlyD family secretion protein